MRVVTLEEHFNVPSLFEKMSLNSDHLKGIAPEIRENLSEIGDIVAITGTATIYETVQPFAEWLSLSEVMQQMRFSMFQILTCCLIGCRGNRRATQRTVIIARAIELQRT